MSQERTRKTWQRGVRTKSAGRGQHVEFLVMSTDTFGKQERHQVKFFVHPRFSLSHNFLLSILVFLCLTIFCTVIFQKLPFSPTCGRRKLTFPVFLSILVFLSLPNFALFSPQFPPFFPFAKAVSRAKPPLATVVSCDGSGAKPIITDQLTERTEALTTRTGFGETADTTSSS